MRSADTWRRKGKYASLDELISGNYITIKGERPPYIYDVETTSGSFRATATRTYERLSGTALDHGNDAGASVGLKRSRRSVAKRGPPGPRCSGIAEELAEKVRLGVVFGWRSGLPLRYPACFQRRL
jgi:hypothetical protein